jgi:hypothetical protein
VTRFDVTTSQTTRAFHHYTVGGELMVEEMTVLSHHVDDVVCRWCGHGRNVAQISDDEVSEDQSAGDRAGEEPGAARTP